MYFSLEEYTAGLDPFTLARRIDAETSLYRWAEVVLGYDKLDPNVHGPMCERDENALPIRGRENRTTQVKELDLEPRYSLKSSIAKAAVMYFLVFNPNGRVLISGHVHKEAKKFLAGIKYEYERNETFRAFYGDWAKLAEQWAADAIKVAPRNSGAKDPSIDTAGADMSKTGGHYDLIVVDDIQSRENVESEVQRENVRVAIQEYFPQLTPYGGMIVKGTRYHRQDVYWWIQCRRAEAVKLHGATLAESDLAKYLFNVTVKSAWNPDGSLYYPSVLSAEFLLQQSIELEEYLFSVWYRNEPIEESAKVFRNVEARERDFDLVLDSLPYAEFPNGTRASLYVTLAWDPAGRRSTKRSDFHGVTVNGNTSADVWFTLEALELKLPLDALLARVVSLVRHYHCAKILIETRGGSVQGLYIDLLRPEMKAAGLGHIEIEEWSPGNLDSKVTQIKTLQPRWNQHRWWLRRGFCDPLKRQLDNFPQLEHDDVLDSMLQHKKFCRPAEPDDLDPIAAGEEAFDLDEGNAEQETVGGPWIGLGTPDYSAA